MKTQHTRRDYCEKDGISITYTDNDVCFEDVNTAEALLILNDGSIPINNFSKEKTASLLDIYKKIYATILYFRSIDRLEAAI